MKEIIKTLYYDTKYLWKNDRREFWEVYLGMGLVVFMFWFLFWVPAYSSLLQLKQKRNLIILAEQSIFDLKNPQ